MSRASWAIALRARSVAAAVGAALVLAACAQGGAPARDGSASAAATSIEVATYNLRLNLAQDGPNAWPHRRDAVKALIRYHGWDLFGTQEGLIDQIRDLESMSEYARVGVGRDDGAERGEHSAIFFRRDRFELLGHGDFWLSPTPEVPSLGWDATCCKRLATWARLRERRSGKHLLVLSAHFDHEGRTAQLESARLVLRKLKELSRGELVICLGDFNSTPETPQMRAMSAELRDARLASESAPYGPQGTFNDFVFDAPMDRRIDYVFVGPGIRVLRYAVLTDSVRGRYPSDHHPVLTRLALD
ncbi:MAG TPA: endonuclease/exonuclease/phosphatase family protein [Albitalea sp.]|nr:endonuclease/exonuclease/phosphatase family protein [Albitalea sp.]